MENYSRTINYNSKPADLVTLIDITDKKEAEQKLKESEEKYRTIIDSITDIIFEINAIKIEDSITLFSVIQKYKVGNRIGLKIQRGDDVMIKIVTLDKF